MSTHTPAPSSATPASVAVSQRRVLLVGNGMVSHRFCTEWVRLGKHSGARLTVVSEESVPAYDRIHLTETLTGKGASSLELAPTRWYEENDIQLLLNDPVLRIDRATQRIHTASGASHDYDVLILATGSKAKRLPLPGAELPGVFVYRTLADLAAIREKAKQVDTVAVLGGGLLGLEAARALLELGLRTHVIEAANSLMARQLDAEAAAFLQQRVSSMGVHVLTGCVSERIFASDAGLTLVFRDEQTLAVGMIVMAAGVEPRDELARECGLQTGARGGVLVDSSLQTSDTHIFAIGECAMVHGTVSGFAAPGYDMARVLAENLHGKAGQYQAADYPVRLKLMGAEVVTIGNVREEGEMLTFSSPASLRQVLLRRGHVRGVCLLGDVTDVGRLQTAVSLRKRLWPWQRRRFLATGSFWKPEAQEVSLWPAGTTICQCTGVTRGRLSAAVAEGCATLEMLCQRTGAGTVCGSCRPLVAQLCGAPSTVVVRFAPAVLWTCVAVGLLCLATWWLGPLSVNLSVQSWRWDMLWFDSGVKQITGYVLLGVMLLGLLLPARKRLRALKTAGDFSWWRVLHTTVGVASLLALTVHTGFRLGFNMNRVLMLNVLLLAVTGALAGVVISLSHRLSPTLARWLQTGWTLLHTLLCWPLLALVVFHILTVYRY